jgi:ATP synthase F1 gamma subunit
MQRVQELAENLDNMSIIVGLTSAFESLASMKISQTKTRVLSSQAFFNELWHIYTQLRVDSLFRFGRENEDSVNDKTLFIAVTAEGGFSGDIDQKLINALLKDYDPEKHDLVIIGHHGAIQLAQAGVEFLKFFKLPDKDTNINVLPMLELIKLYRSTRVYYQKYEALTQQSVEKIDLNRMVQLAGEKAGENDLLITQRNYIFEPHAYAVVAHLEGSMLEIALSQVILDSKLAQYASRFRAMTVAQDRASESFQDLNLLYHRTKRGVADERLKEILNGRQKVAA